MRIGKSGDMLEAGKYDYGIFGLYFAKRERGRTVLLFWWYLRKNGCNITHFICVVLQFFYCKEYKAKNPR